MADLIRLAPGESPRIVSFKRPFSSFTFLGETYKTWPIKSAMSRIFSQARRSKARTMVIEILPTVAEAEDEAQDLTARFSGYTDGGIWRFSFFKSDFENLSDINQLPDDDMLGYMIIRNDIFSPNETSIRIFESVFTKYSHLHNFVPGQKKYNVLCYERSFSVKGVMYCQQNGKNKACAQVALRSLLSSVFPEKPIYYSELNKIAQQEEPGMGLNTNQIRLVLEHFKINFADLDYDTEEGHALKKKIPYFRFLYAGMESGLGSLVGFEFTEPMGPNNQRARHIIPFFGHTFNQDTWTPQASNAYFPIGSNTSYIPSDEWVNNFIGHDDNFGSNFCIPRKFISRDQVKYVLSLLPYDIQGTPLVAEARAIDFLYKYFHQIETTTPWADRWKGRVSSHTTVVRPILMTRKKYIEHIKNSEDWERRRENLTTINGLDNILPDKFWMVEFSLPNLYSANYSKLGEILITFQSGASEIELAVLRIPGQYVIKLPTDEKFQVITSSLESHVPLFTHEPNLLNFNRWD